MKDEEIVALYFARNEDAIAKTQEQYGWYCSSIAYHILCSIEDSEECVADTWLHTWNSIPPKKPDRLKPYVGRITRNLALNRVKADASRKCGEVLTALEELEVADLNTPEDAMEQKRLSDAITAFLRTLPPTKQRVFVLRYWYFLSLKEISQKTGWKDNRLMVELYRMRGKLKTYLEKEGFEL